MAYYFNFEYPSNNRFSWRRGRSTLIVCLPIVAVVLVGVKTVSGSLRARVNQKGVGVFGVILAAE